VADGVEGVLSLFREPFVFAESVVIGGVHDGAGWLREGDSAEGVAVARPAVEEQGGYGEVFQPRQDFLGDYDSLNLAYDL